MTLLEAAEPLTAERLREVLSYDQYTGDFRRLVALSAQSKIGQIAGSTHPAGYWTIKIDGIAYLAHRLAVLYMTGKFPDHQVDHEDTDRLNNRWTNLRQATPSSPWSPFWSAWSVGFCIVDMDGQVCLTDAGQEYLDGRK